MPYINTVSNYLGSNTLFQIVYIYNVQTDSVPYVYFAPGSGTNDDSASVEWANSFYDYYSQAVVTNYLILENDYTLAVSTNVAYSGNSIPDNFTFVSQLNSPFVDPTDTNFPPAVSGFPTNFMFLPGATTNMYSSTYVTLSPTTAGTNLVPGGALTNIAGRAELDSSNTLNISSASIAGVNYLTVRAPQELANDGQARIVAPYSDLYLGSTNGTLVMSNVTVSSFPGWNGTVEAWSTSFQFPTTNTPAATSTNSSSTNTTSTVTTVTNYYEVLVVYSDLSPVFNAQHQDVALYASNNVIISDSMTVFRSFTTTATNLVVTTNDITSGALAPQGNLYIAPLEYSWAQSTPNLSTLTNYGQISTANLTSFGSSAVPYLAFVNFGDVYNGGGTVVHAQYFENDGSIDAGSGSFSLYAGLSYLTNGFINAGGSVSLTANSMVLGNQQIFVSQGLNFAATNLLTDTGVTSGNSFNLGSGYAGFGAVAGFSLTAKPTVGDLLGSQIYASSPGAVLKNVWAGIDYGVSTLGYSNNEAVGQLTLDSTLSGVHVGKFSFSSAGGKNAIYIDSLQFADLATNGVNSGFDFSQYITINTNMMIYFADAMANGVDISAQIDSASLSGKNNGRLRWVSSYSGFFSSVLVTNSDGSTMYVNAALAQSTVFDSNGNGIPNADDPTPFFSTGDVNFTARSTNAPAPSTLLDWHSIPAATNVIYYSTNLIDPDWMILTNFVNATNVPPVNGWPITNLVAIPINPLQPQFYKIAVIPNNQFYGQ